MASNCTAGCHSLKIKFESLGDFPPFLHHTLNMNQCLCSSSPILLKIPSCLKSLQSLRLLVVDIYIYRPFALLIFHSPLEQKNLQNRYMNLASEFGLFASFLQWCRESNFKFKKILKFLFFFSFLPYYYYYSRQIWESWEHKWSESWRDLKSSHARPNLVIVFFFWTIINKKTEIWIELGTYSVVGLKIQNFIYYF
jgi:hypothetical protein